MENCFHCGESIPRDVHIVARVRDAHAAQPTYREQPVCCHGCRAVAELISGAGLDDYYRFRNTVGQRPVDVDAKQEPYRVYDQPELLAQLTRDVGIDGCGTRAATLILDGVGCAACGWLIDRMLKRIDGVCAVTVNVATARMHVKWLPSKVSFSQLLSAIAQLGYRPHPLTACAAFDAARAERHSALKRLAVAGFGMMQVMMFAVALYAGDFDGPGAMEANIREYLRVASALCATPVLFYSGWPILTQAWHALRARGVTMDVPVSIGLMLAYVASLWNTATQRGDVYFDSVTMFVFFLGVARFIEMLSRHRTGNVTEALARLMPLTAHRIRTSGIVDDVATTVIEVGDELLIRVGETIPADAVVIEGASLIDESMLTGEAAGVTCNAGHAIAAGTINLQAPLRVRVTAIGNATVLSGIVRLLERAGEEKAPQVGAADRMAAWFLSRVLIGAGLVAIVWWYIDPSRVVPITLAVLVATCPCALSLATPIALAAATAALARRGVLITRSGALEALTKVTRVIFDKTGTLTRGELTIRRCDVLGRESEARCRDIAAALERHSEHPIARAFADRAPSIASDVRVVPGEGVEGTIDGRRYRIGRRGESDTDGVYLSDDTGELAAFYLSDRVRSEAPQVVAALKALGLPSAILSGDARDAVARAASECGIQNFLARQSPGAKLAHVQAQPENEPAMMVGDGINDAPVLKGAAVSVAMACASSLARVSADIVLVGDSLHALPIAIQVARRTQRIVRQNLAWAAVYNFVALSAAALGLLPPWLAAVGMSLSSMLVVMNAWRLNAPASSVRAQDREIDRSNDPVPSTTRPRDLTLLRS